MASQPYLGAIFIFTGNYAPNGFLLCEGQLLPISQYTALFSILGTTYGGNGTTDFALPDLRGRAPIGQGAGPGLSPVVLGQSGGVDNVTISAGNMPKHNHALSVSTSPGSQHSPSNNFIAAGIDTKGGSVLGYNTSATSSATLAPNSVGSAGSGTPMSVQNPYLGINYIIAIQGIYPSQG